MSLTSREFLVLFIPLTLIVYYRLARTPRLKTFVLLGASYYFYSFAGWKFIPALFGLSLATYLLARWSRIGWGIWLNLGALILFKYWNFGIENFNAFFFLFQFRLSFLNLGLPLGLSFFVFKHIGYLLDVKQKRYPPAADFWTFAAFSAYFPQISAGPISSYQETASQFANLPDKLDGSQAAGALTYVSMGLAKKILIADTLNYALATSINSVGGFSGVIPAWYLVIAYTMQLYFDFSGYTDLTLGISQLFGIRLPRNFNNPYLANNPAEFWERWHVSLSNWFRVYLFSPLSRFFLRRWGSDKRELAQYSANLIAMGLVGLWHGSGWGFIFWGLYHGAWLNLNAAWKRANRAIHPILEKGIFLFLISVGWALFMARDGGHLAYIFGQMFGFGGLGEMSQIADLLGNYSTLALAFALPIAFSGAAEAENLVKRIEGNKLARGALGAIAALCIFLIEEQLVSKFIYIDF